MNDVTKNEVEAMVEYTVNVALDTANRIREASTKSIPITISADAAFAFVMVTDFMQSYPVMVAEIDGQQVGAKLNLEDAFRKFAQLRLTGICPDCGESMAMHEGVDHVQTH